MRDVNELHSYIMVKTPLLVHHDFKLVTNMLCLLTYRAYPQLRDTGGFQLLLPTESA